MNRRLNHTYYAFNPQIKNKKDQGATVISIISIFTLGLILAIRVLA